MFVNLSNCIVKNLLLFVSLLVLQLQFSHALNDRRDLLLGSEEKDALSKFKAQVLNLLPEEFMKSDFYLIRWLRVAHLDIPRARGLLLENVRWRKANNISNILSEELDDVAWDFPIAHDGYDKEGRPVMTLDFAEWDLRYAVLQGKMPRVQRYLTQAIERSMQNIFVAQKKGKSVTRVFVMVDAENFNVFQHFCPQCTAALASWAVVGDSYYPNFYDEVVVVNAPQAAVVALNTIRPFMSDRMRNIIKMFNSNKRLWMSYLDKRIDRDQRSERYGGTR